jgi:hypothetical protein
MANEDATSQLPPPPLVAVVGWFLPGGGYFLIGQRTRGLVIGVTVIAMFVLGVLIAGIRVVDAPNLIDTGGSGIVARILQKPWFIGQALMGPLGLAAAWVANALGPEHRAATARLGEIGTLYTAVAGMLNLLAIIDASHRAGNKGRR